MAEKREILTLDKIKEQFEEKKDDKDKLSFLKNFLKEDNYKKFRKDLVKLAFPLIVGKPTAADYKIIYDSLGEGLEPIYYWLVDYMSDSGPGGLGLDVKKGEEWIDASVGGGYFGEIGQRSTLMQQKAMEYLGAINQVIKSILNLIYDLREFDIKLKAYDQSNSEDAKERREGMISLKGVWMDQVDARKGRGSINLLAQDLQFATLRDAFFYVDDTKSVEKLDLNLRVRNILTRKLQEFDAWYKFSEKEIRKRFEIEKTYLRSQYGTLKLYANWIKPYLLAAQKLKVQKTDLNSLMKPNVVNAFSNMEMEIKLYGKKEVKPENVHESLSNVKLDKKYYAVIEITTNFRSVPSALSGQGGRHYIHGGRTTIGIKGYVMDDVEVGVLESHELYEDMDLIDDYVGNSLKQLQDEVDEFLIPKVQVEVKKEKPKILDNPFKGVIRGFKEALTPLVGSSGKGKIVPKFIYDDVEKVTKETAVSLANRIYSIYKKTHGMITA